jgi:hypothetical protein
MGREKLKLFRALKPETVISDQFRHRGPVSTATAGFSHGESV